MMDWKPGACRLESSAWVGEVVIQSCTAEPYGRGVTCDFVTCDLT